MEVFGTSEKFRRVVTCTVERRAMPWGLSCLQIYFDYFLTDFI